MKYFKSIAKDGSIGVRQSKNEYVSVLWSICPESGEHKLRACSSKSQANIGNQKYLESLGFRFYKGKCEEISKEEYKMIKDYNDRSYLLYSGEPIEKLFA